jgi:hypothetical protein
LGQERTLSMDFQNRRYSEDEVSAIVRRALEGRSANGGITHDDLVNIAAQSGISREQIEQAIEEQETLGRLDSAKAEWLKRHRAEFFGHLRAYLIVIFMLMIINLMTSRGYFWFVWPAMGWGIGLAFHASDTFFVSKEKIERGARRLLKREQRKKKSGSSDIYDEILDSSL